MNISTACAQIALGTALFVSAGAYAEDSPTQKGSMYVGNIADACINSAMSASVLADLRDKGASQAEADIKIADLLKDDPNKEFLNGLSKLNSRVVFGFPAVVRTSQEQIALARCARSAKDKPSLTPERIEALIPAILECQSAKEPVLPAPKCVFALVFQALP
jgi:hypothetical protein